MTVNNITHATLAQKKHSVKNLRNFFKAFQQKTLQWNQSTTAQLQGFDVREKCARSKIASN